MQQAFDWVDRDLLKYKLLSIGINGKIFNAIDQLYRKTVSCVKLKQTGLKLTVAYAKEIHYHQPYLTFT